MKRGLEIAILTETRSFASLQEEWDELYHDCPLSTPFQSWSWLYSWWESFGEGYELRLITVRDRDLLVGLIPLMLERRWGLRRLLFIGGRALRRDLLAKKGWEDKVSEAGIRAFRQIDSWHVIDVRDLSSVAAAWGLSQQWNGRQVHKLSDYYLFIEVEPWEKVLASLSRNHRSTVRRTLRHADEDGVYGSLAGPEEVEQAAHRLVALHRELRQGRQIASEHLTPDFESFIMAAARRVTDRGLGGILELWRDGEVILSSFTLFGRKITDAYLVGVRRATKQHYQWSSLGIYHTLDLAHSRNSAYVCLAQAGEPYKQRWVHKSVPHYRIVLCRGPVLWSLYLIYLSLRPRAIRYIKADSTPKLIKDVAEWLKGR